jgi:hypothetical protein
LSRFVKFLIEIIFLPAQIGKIISFILDIIQILMIEIGKVNQKPGKNYSSKIELEKILKNFELYLMNSNCCAKNSTTFGRFKKVFKYAKNVKSVFKLT